MLLHQRWTHSLLVFFSLSLSLLCLMHLFFDYYLIHNHEYTYSYIIQQTHTQTHIYHIYISHCLCLLQRFLSLASFVILCFVVFVVLVCGFWPDLHLMPVCTSQNRSIIIFNMIYCVVNLNLIFMSDVAIIL